MPALLMLEALLFVSALSLDAFLTSFTYGAGNIKIPFRSALIVNIVCGAFLAAALYAGQALSGVIPKIAGVSVSAGALFLIGVIKLFESILNRGGHSGFCAPENLSQVLSAGKAASLGVALSLDSLTAGFGAGLTESGFLWMIDFSLVLGILFIYLGCFLGRKFSERTELNLSWLSGAVFIFLGISKLVF